MITAWINTHLLSFIVFAPLLWGLALLPLSERQAPLAKLLVAPPTAALTTDGGGNPAGAEPARAQVR